MKPVEAGLIEVPTTDWSYAHLHHVQRELNSPFFQGDWGTVEPLVILWSLYQAQVTDHNDREALREIAEMALFFGVDIIWA